MHQLFILLSYPPLVYLLLPFCFLVMCRRYFVCTCSYMGKHSAYEVSLLLYRCTLYMCMACFVLSNGTHVNMDAIILGLHPTPVRLIMYASSLMPGYLFYTI